MFAWWPIRGAANSTTAVTCGACSRPHRGRSLLTPVHLLLGMSLIASLAIVAVAVVPAKPAGASGAPCATNPTVSATPDWALDNMFQSYGNAGMGYSWTGGDGTESVALPDGRELWLFDDTFLGTVTNGLRNPKKTPYLHNSFVVQDHGALTQTYYTHRTTRPTAFLNPKPAHPFMYAFWPGATVVYGNTLEVLGGVQKFRKNALFTQVGVALATFRLPDFKRLSYRLLPQSQVDWPGGEMTDGGYTYLYGNSGSGLFVARVAGTDLRAPWSYYDGSGWTTNVDQAAPVDQIPTLSHYSVSKVAGEYLLVAITSYSGEIVGAFGCSPTGPFGPVQDLYSTPEPTSYPARDGVVTYGAHAHPELSPSANTLVVSYDVNPAAPGAIQSPDSSIYRPRFVYITVG